jgi:aspartate/methionine/tyrosine aminotransferase
MGGYYAYVQFPSAYTHAEVLRTNGRVGSEEVAKYLATELGVVCLPGSFFMPVCSLPAQSSIEILQNDGADGRFAIANVDDEVVISLEPRLRRMNELMGV